MDRLLNFDPETGILTAEAGVSLAKILDFAVPRGFFLPVTPGTKYVTLGGAIANDIHGKNHEAAARLATTSPASSWCARTAAEGSARPPRIQTGTPRRSAGWADRRHHLGSVEAAADRIAQDRLRGNPVHGIDEFLDLKRQYQHVEYTVSWVDCASTAGTLRAASSCWANTRRHPAS